MKTKPELPKGWTFPMKSSEIREQFPEVGSTHWVHSASSLEEWPSPGEACLHLKWEPRIAMAQPSLTVHSVPSKYRAEIRAWIDESARAELQAWLRELVTDCPEWLEHAHGMHWFWRPGHDEH